MSDLSQNYVYGTVQGDAVVATITVEQLRDSAVSYALRDELIALVDATKAKDVVLDLDRVQFVGSVGLLAFLAVRRHLTAGRIVLCNMSKQVRQMFALCHLIPAGSVTETPFAVEATLDDALTRVAA